MSEELTELPSQTQMQLFLQLQRMSVANAEEIKNSLICTQKGEIAQKFEDYIVVLLRDPLFQNAIKTNLMTDRVEIVKNVGWNRCGTALSDIDLRYICFYLEKHYDLVNPKSIQEALELVVEKTKTECGCRFIPMTDSVYDVFKNILANRRKVKTEMIIDGYSNFLLLDKNENPKVALHIENEMRWAMKKYKKLHPDVPLPHITPHVYRHTFCTNMANAGMDIKTLQYIMGHSDVGVTLNVYTHASYERAAEQMAKLIDFKDIAEKENRRKSG